MDETPPPSSVSTLNCSVVPDFLLAAAAEAHAEERR